MEGNKYKKKCGRNVKNITNDILNFSGKWMKLENNILSEVTQTQKENYHMYSLISGF